MVDPEVVKRWKVIEANLRSAETFLAVRKESVVPDKLLHDFYSYVDHNELQLAMEELEALAEEFGAKPSFWKWLSEAARLMELEEKANEYQKRFHEAPRPGA